MPKLRRISKALPAIIGLSLTNHRKPSTAGHKAGLMCSQSPRSPRENRYFPIPIYTPESHQISWKSEKNTILETKAAARTIRISLCSFKKSSRLLFFFLIIAEQIRLYLCPVSKAFQDNRIIYDYGRH